MSSKDKEPSTAKSLVTGSCLRPGIPESDTADSGEESEPTYRHYDNFETDVCLTQDEDEEPMASNIPIVRDIVGDLTPTQARKCNGGLTPREGSSGREVRDPIPRDNFGVVTNMSRTISSDSDSCTETEAPPGPSGQTTTDETTTSTSESEETQIWVPVSQRPSAVRQFQGTTTPPVSATSSNGSDHSRPQSFVHKAGTPGPRSANSAGSLAIMTSPTSNGPTDRSTNGGISSDNTVRRDSKDSWHNLQSNTQSSGVQKRVSPTKQVSLSLLRHDEMTGTITLDIRNLPNGDSGLGHEDDRFCPSDDGPEMGVSGSMLRHGQVTSTLGRHASFLDTICVMASGLYMLLVVVVGVVVASIFAVHQFPALFEGFYIYLHVVSITFLVYSYTYILRLRALPSNRRRTIVSSLPVSNRNRNNGIDDITDEQTGSFYLRLGAVGFGIGSMINSGLHFGEYFEMMSSPVCNEVLYGVRPLLHLCFTFAQLYFVFLNATMCTHKYRQLARFGLMHMVAANMCVWWENVVKETLRDLDRDLRHTHGEGNVTALLQESHPNSNCYLTTDSLMGDVVNSSGPYLYPCTIIYSLICSSILLVMWLNLNNTRQQTKTFGSSERSNVDCSSSSRGLFLGIIVFVAAVIVLITFSVLVRSREFISAAVRVGHFGDVILYVLTSVSIIIAFHRMYVLKPLKDNSLGFEDALMVISLFGVYVLCVSNIVAGILVESQQYGHLLIISSCFRLIQATVQTMFLMSAIRRRAWKKDQEVNKPGKEFVTFLLICNIAFWVLNLFEVQRANANPIQEVFYGSVGWTIITHAAVPLSIFFRFHSTVCLANIWKHAWRYTEDSKY